MSVFLDTNIFVYSVSECPEDQAKKIIANQLIAKGDFSLSLQVVQEFVNTCLTKKRLNPSLNAILETVHFLFEFPCLIPSRNLVLNALDLQQRYKIKYWDAAILAAAHELGCHTIYSEDFNHAQSYDGITVLNPFL